VKSASGRIVCGTAGRIFRNYSTPFCTKSDVTAQLTVGISRENLPMSLSIDVVGHRQYALASTAAADQVPRSPAACRPPIMSALYIFDARDAVATCCVDT